MTDTPLYEDDDDFVPRRPAMGKDLLSASGQIAVEDILALIASERWDRVHRATQAAEVIRWNGARSPSLRAGPEP